VWRTPDPSGVLTAFHLPVLGILPRCLSTAHRFPGASTGSIISRLQLKRQKPLRIQVTQLTKAMDNLYRKNSYNVICSVGLLRNSFALLRLTLWKVVELSPRGWERSAGGRKRLLSSDTSGKHMRKCTISTAPGHRHSRWHPPVGSIALPTCVHPVYREPMCHHMCVAGVQPTSFQMEPCHAPRSSEWREHPVHGATQKEGELCSIGCG
jgi:hypothetical protein